MARKAAPKPIITYTETLARAIRSIDVEIQEWRERCNGLPAEQFDQCTLELRQKRAVLCNFYLIETGVEYV